MQKILKTELVWNNNLYMHKGIYTYLNPVSYLDALKNKQLYASMDGIFADGNLLVCAIKMVYGQRVTRRSFDMTSMAPELLSFANDNNKSVCVVATHQDKMEKAVELFRQKYPNIEWKECRNGFFSSEDEMLNKAKNIAKSAPDFLIVGMGAVMQEKFLLMCKNAGFEGIGFTCGGFIHQIAESNNKQYYPKWMDKYNLRFIYRMCKEPYTRKRYAIAAFVFPWKFLMDRFFD